MEEFEARCRRQGLPVTSQRRAVLRALSAREDHPTADQLHEDLRREHPDLSRTTVYRVLETLVRLGVVTKVSHPGAALRYDAFTARHHHLVCDACGRLSDLVLPGIDALPLPDTRAQDFEIADYSVHFHGRCGRCRLLPGGASNPAAPRGERRPRRRGRRPGGRPLRADG